MRKKSFKSINEAKSTSVLKIANALSLSLVTVVMLDLRNVFTRFTHEKVLLMCKTCKNNTSFSFSHPAVLGD